MLRFLLAGAFVALACPVSADNGRAAGFDSPGFTGNGDFDRLNGTMTGNLIRSLTYNPNTGNWSGTGSGTTWTAPQKTALSLALSSNRRAARSGNGVDVTQRGSVVSVGRSTYNSGTGQRIGRTGGRL
jgi:hypothetical protein